MRRRDMPAAARPADLQRCAAGGGMTFGCLSLRVATAGRVFDRELSCSYNSYMTKAVGSRELKNRLGAYLRDVREGWTIVVTDRGRPIAELRPIAPAATDEEAQLLKLGALGLVSPRKRTTLPERKRVRIAGKPLSETIVEDREDRV